MSDSRTSALQYALDNNSRFLDELKDFLTIACISTDPERYADMEQAAGWVAKQLENLGISGVNIYPTAGHPVV